MNDEVITRYPEVTHWPHCSRCGAPMDNPGTPQLCRECRDNDFERACSYGGTAYEIHRRYMAGRS